MEAYGKILLIAMPAFVALVLLEWAWGWWRGRHIYQNMDAISSLSSGITNVVKDVLQLSVTILSYSWLVKHVAIGHVEAGFWTYFIAFMALDFSGYWIHRMSHEINFFWNKHAIHHSSEYFNLACALRQSVSVFVQLFGVFLLPAALFGVPPEVIGLVAPLHLFAQFWYHTELIGKMGWLEYIIVTPSHHRVHHAINPEYLDKNHGQIFIFWDKLFGTFQEELPDVPPKYGITRPVQTYNPIKINFLHLWLMMQDAWRASDWRDKLRIWWMPTGWRPADVDQKWPLYKIDDPYHYQRFAPPASRFDNAWAWVQLMANFGLIFYLFGRIAAIGAPDMFWYGAYIFLAVYAYTEYMDGHARAAWWETLKSAFGLWLVYRNGSWFGIDQVIPYGTMLVVGWLVVSAAVVWVRKSAHQPVLNAA